MKLDAIQAAAAAQFDKQSQNYGKGHILEQTPDVELGLKFIPLRPGWRALDVATGGGHTGLLLAARGCEVTLGDISANMLERAAKLGYDFDRFWLHDPTLNAARWLRILHTRGIKGLVLVGLMDTTHLPDELRPVWEQLPAVVTGVRTRDPALSFCSVDHHNLALMAFERALALGYRRPGLVLDNVIDALVERRFSAGYFTGQRMLPRAQHLPIFGELARVEKEPGLFRAWLDRHAPDVVFTLYNNVLGWLKDAGRRVPEDIGVIQLEWRATRPEIAGMNQHNFVTGEAAVDMIVSQIHNNEVGVQEFPRATLIGATWVDGASVRSQQTGAMVGAAPKGRKQGQRKGP